MILCHDDIISKRTGKTAVCCRSIFVEIEFAPVNVKQSIPVLLKFSKLLRLIKHGYSKSCICKEIPATFVNTISVHRYNGKMEDTTKRRKERPPVKQCTSPGAWCLLGGREGDFFAGGVFFFQRNESCM